MSTTAEESVNRIKSEIDASEGRMGALAARLDGEIKAHGEATGATGKKLDDEVKARESLQGEMAEIKASLEASSSQQEEMTALKALVEEAKAAGVKSDELIAELQEHVKSGQRPGWGGEVPDELKSVGERYTGSDEFKAVKKSRGSGGPSFEAGSLLGSPPTMEQKATFVSTAADRLVEPFRRDFVEPQLRELRIRSLLNVQTTTSNAVEYVQETGFAATGSATGTQTHGAAEFIGEVEEIPEAQLEMELKNEPIKDVAHWIPASENILNDLPRLRAYIDMRLLYGLGYVEDTDLLYGSGSGSQLQGITTEAGVQTYAWSAGLLLPVPDTKFDAVRRSMTLAHIEEYVPDGVVLHPTDWEEIETVKATDGHYLLLPVQVNPGEGMPERLWRVPVVVTNAITAGTWLVGSFRRGAELWDRQSGTITISDSHEDMFTSSTVAIKAKQREAQVILRPEAFVNGTFDAAPS